METLTIVQRAGARDVVSQLVDADYVRVVRVNEAFEGRERVTTVVTHWPQYVRAVLARLYRSKLILWYT